MRFILALLLVFLPIKAKAETLCLNPQAMHQSLIANGYFLKGIAITGKNYVMVLYVNADDNFVILAETTKLSCVVSTGAEYIVPVEHHI